MFAQAVPPGSRLLAASTKSAGRELGVGHARHRRPHQDRRHQRKLEHEKSRSEPAGSTRRWSAYRRQASAPRAGATRRPELRRWTPTGHLAGRSAITRLRPQSASYVLTLPAGSAALLNVSKARPGRRRLGADQTGGTTKLPPPVRRGDAGSSQTQCMSRLQSGGVSPVWSSVAACGYPTPTSLDPNGMASGGTAGVPDGTVLQDVATCSSCLPSGDSWNDSADTAVDNQQRDRKQPLHPTGATFPPVNGVNVTIQNSGNIFPDTGI